jgi:group I intron endonuclease
MDVIIGIYKITSPTGRVYIGKSKNIKNRFSGYNKPKKSKLQVRLYNSFIKHGVGNHVFEIIEECPISELYCRERHWQNFYNVLDKDKGLNCVLSACENHPAVTTDETRKNMSESKSGIKSKQRKEVICTLTGKEWISAKDCAEENNIIPNTLVYKLLGKNTNNTSFIYKKDLHLKETRANQDHHGFKGEKNPMFGKSGKSAPSSRAVICTKTGKEWDTIKQCAIDNCINKATLCGWLNGRHLNKSTFIFKDNE